MTQEEIIELFIQAADVDRRLPDTARPARLKAQALPYVHDFSDMAGWGSERLAEERNRFFNNRLSTEDVATWEKALALMVHVERERDRRCLWAWAKSKAGKFSFAKWCREVEHIHRNYGSECKSRAIEHIYEYFLRNDAVNGKISINSTLHTTPEKSDIRVILDEPRTFAWMAPGAFVSKINAAAHDFSWAEKQNARRRKREGKKEVERFG